MPMTSILLIVGRNYNNQFKWFYLKNEKHYSQFFAAYLKSISNVERFGKEDEPYSLHISKIIDSKRRGYLNI